MIVNLPCEIVQDLLPSYIDELTSETTNISVAAHLETCENCRRIYRSMKNEDTSYTDSAESGKEENSSGSANAAVSRASVSKASVSMASVSKASVSVSRDDSAELDFLKKTRKRGHLAVLGGVLLTAFLVLGAILAIYYLPSKVTSSYMISCAIYSGDDQTFELNGNLIDNSRGVAGIAWEEDGDTLNLVIRSSRKSFFRKNDFQEKFTAGQNIRQVTINDTVVIWYEGEQILSEVSQIYKDKLLYIGSAVDDGTLAWDIGLTNYLNYLYLNYTTELQTTTEPYGLTYHFEGTVSEQLFEELQETLPSYGAAMIATIDNMGYMEFDLDVEGTQRTISITEEEADNMLGSSVKEMARTPYGLQQLIIELGIDGNIYGSTQSWGAYVKDNFALQVSNKFSEDIYGIGLDLEINGQTVASETIYIGNNTPLSQGLTDMNFTFTPEDCDCYVDMAEDQVSIEVKIYGEGNGMTNVLDTITVELDPDDPDYYDGSNYSRTFTISGNSEEGFTVE